MARYHHKRNLNSHLRRTKRANRGVILVVVFAVALVSSACVYVWQASKTSNTTASSTKAVSYYNADVKRLFNNEVFRFESKLDWQFSAASSSLGNRYVYFVSNNGLIKYQLDIDLGGGMQDDAVNYISAVKVIDGKMSVQSTSPKCNTPERRKSTTSSIISAEYQGVKYLCHLTQSNEAIAAGVIGGSYDIPLYNSKGSLRRVSLKFTDHSGQYYQDSFKQIVESFKLN